MRPLPLASAQNGLMVKRGKKSSDGMEILDAITGQDSKMKALIEQEAENLRIAKTIYELRNNARMSQVELAKRIGTTKSVISKLEDADYKRQSLALLRRIAAALDCRIELLWVAASQVSIHSKSDRPLPSCPPCFAPVDTSTKRGTVGDNAPR